MGWTWRGGNPFPPFPQQKHWRGAESCEQGNKHHENQEGARHSF
jgi:hypothetical protein